MRATPILLGAWIALAGAAAGPAAGAEPVARHGLAMHGDLKYGPDFAHLDYVDPNAPRGGEVRLAAMGTAFDSFNPFVVKGNAADGIARIYDTLLEGTADEPFSEYGLLAESVTTPADRSWVVFRLRPEARFHDGRPVTADDVIFSFESLRDKGSPFYRAYYGNVARVERLGEREVRFTFKPGENRELPLILGQLPVLPKHFYGPDRPFERATLDIPLGSGPYRLDSFEPGRRVSYRRVADYWGRDLPINRGRHNFDVIHHDYYRDDTVAIEAFKGGAFDFRLENSAKHWATAYDIPAVRDGRLRKEEIANSRPSGMQGFVFNTRRPLFADRRVRAALAWAFDFEWSNKTLFYGQYRRSRSFFENSDLAATGLPGPDELALLEPHRAALPPEVFTTEYRPPATDGSGNLRENLRRAVNLLAEAGWKIDPKTRRLTGPEGREMRFEILLVMPLFERVVLPFKQNLERLGIAVDVRTVDSAQYESRIEDFDFDVVVGGFPQSLSPGNEQRSYWGSAFAEQPGSYNLMGIRDPVVDALIEKIIAAPDRASLVTATRALDRVLQWGHWVIPHWHVPFDRVVFWDRFGRPAVTPPLGFRFDAWWIDPARAARLAPAAAAKD